MSNHELSEAYSMMMKFARRCAYDLRHASSHVPRGEFRELFEKRSEEWISLFDPDRMKQYRVEILQQLEEAESENLRLRTQLKEAGIYPNCERPF